MPQPRERLLPPSFFLLLQLFFLPLRYFLPRGKPVSFRYAPLWCHLQIVRDISFLKSNLDPNRIELNSTVRLLFYEIVEYFNVNSWKGKYRYTTSLKSRRCKQNFNRCIVLHLLVVHLLRCLVFFAYIQGFTSRSLDVPGYPKYLKRSMHPCFVLYFSRENFSEWVKASTCNTRVSLEPKGQTVA